MSAAVQVGAVIRAHFGDCYRTAYVGKIGHKLVHLVVIDSCSPGVHVITMPLSFIRGVEVLEYPARRCRRFMKDAGKRLGITKAAKDLLR